VTRDEAKSKVQKVSVYMVNQQELSYPKQIARELRTQFVEGISVTLKSTLRVTQGPLDRSYTTYY